MRGWRSTHSTIPCSPGFSVRSSVIPATCNMPAASRRTINRGSSIESCFRRNWKNSSESQAMVNRMSGNVTLATLAPGSVMRRLPMSRRGFQPSQPVTTDPISTGWPICAASRCATASWWSSTRGKMIKRTASNIRQAATTKIKTTVRAAHSVLRSEAGRAGRKLEDARAKGIIGRSGAILIRKGAAAALNPRMDLAAAYEFSRYAQRLRVADPGLCASVEAVLDRPFPWADGELGGLARGSDAAALAVALRQLRQRVYLHVLLRDLTGRAELYEVCATMTRLAELAIGAAVDAHSSALAAIHGEPIGADTGAAEQMIVVGMG